MRDKALNHIVLIDINPFVHIYISCDIYYSSYSNMKIQNLDVFFSSTFPDKTFAKVLFPVRATFFVETTSSTSRFLFPITIAMSLFSGDASQKYISRHEISIGRCLQVSPQELIVDEDEEGDSDIDFD